LTVRGHKPSWGINVAAGRRGTRTPALAFGSGIKSSNMISSVPGFEVFIPRGPPDLLNFAIFGSMEFSIKGKKYECKDIRLGQGHIPFWRNDWWLGGENCTATMSWERTMSPRCPSPFPLLPGRPRTSNRRWKLSH